jgi:hypothetical protein
VKTSDRTLLQTLGFADPDRSTPARAHLHDMAVRYLMQPEVALAVWKRFAKRYPRDGFDFDGVTEAKATPEHLLKTQSGFVVGFADLLLSAAAIGTERPREHDGKRLEWFGSQVVVEVKTSLHDPGAAVRQLRLYAEHLGATPVLAVVEPVSVDASAIIRSAGIGLASFGPKFQAFLAESRSAEPDLEL